jgi:hypothetical protein
MAVIVDTAALENSEHKKYVAKAHKSNQSIQMNACSSSTVGIDSNNNNLIFCFILYSLQTSNVLSLRKERPLAAAALCS